MVMPASIPERFRTKVVLKADLFSTIERGHFRSGTGEVEAVLRRLDRVPFWARPLARHLARREADALARLPPGIGPALLAADRDFIVRGWIAGLPLHVAAPHGRTDIFRAAKKAMRAMHRAGIAHNDLAKEQNWLVEADGTPRLTDFPLASVHTRRTRIFRLLAREDLRHLLKMKRRYCPDAMAPAETRLAANPSLPSRIWKATGKRVYLFVTRRIFGWMDREGAGDTTQANRIAAAISDMDDVTAASVVPYCTATTLRLYAFVESASASEPAIREALRARGLPAPDHIQIAPRLPRMDHGDIHGEALRMIAQNQVDLIGMLAMDEAGRAALDALVAGRLNWSDRRLHRGA